MRSVHPGAPWVIYYSELGHLLGSFFCSGLSTRPVWIPGFRIPHPADPEAASTAAAATRAHHWMKYHVPIGIWTVSVTCLSFCTSPAAEAVKQATVDSIPRGVVSPPVVLVFEHPTNGSVIQGTNAELQFTLRSSRLGPALTPEEVTTLREDGTCICFAVQGVFQNEPTLCTEFTTEILSVAGLLPGAWHTITATIHHTAVSGVGHAEVIRVLEDVESKWDFAGDSVTMLVAVDSSTTMCGDSVCLDSSDVRETYFDTVYR